MKVVERWDVFELPLQGPTGGNPFVDVSLSARFSNGEQTLEPTGFYDGEGRYIVRFMPPALGEWRYETRSNRPELNGKAGTFTCTPPSAGNHGPVRVAEQRKPEGRFHFVYADGTPYRQIGTTCYAWTHQGDELEEQTLATLKDAPFNKIRMCIFPKNYAFNQNEPVLYPFERGREPGPPVRSANLWSGLKWDFTRFNPESFRHQEKRILQLRHLGIEADIILFHPYDKGRWGFDRMDSASDDRYLRYVVARLAAYRNVWWSMANEYDFMKEKKELDWDRFFQIVHESDPYDHLRSIHNGTLIYDHNQPWVTHASIQNGAAVADFGRAILYRDVYRKPVVFDEVKYEGNIEQRWGNISAEEMVHRFWQGTIGGTYVGHGETYKHPQDIIWWARGGKLYGQSPARIAFLRKVMEAGPAEGLEPIDKWQDEQTAGQPGEYYLVYFGKQRPEEWLFELPRQGLSAGMRFTVEVLDTWNMTVEPVEGEFEVITDTTYRYHAKGGAKGQGKVKLPGRAWMALRIRRVEGDVVEAEEGEKIYGEAE
jgi:hypothetical protein